MDESNDVQVRRTLQAVARRKWLVVVCVLVALVFGGIRAQREEEYSASALLDAGRPVETDDALDRPAPRDESEFVPTQAQVLRSAEFRAAVNERQGTSSRRLAGIEPEIERVPDTSLIRITVRARAAAVVADTANAYATLFVERRNRETVDTATRRSVELQRQAEAVQPELNEVSTAIREQTESYNRLQLDRADSGVSRGIQLSTADLDVLQARFDTLSERQSAFRTRAQQYEAIATLGDSGAKVVSAAQAPARAVPQNRARALLFSGLFGAVAGIALGLSLDLLSDRIRDRDDLMKAAAGLPVLGVVPRQARARRTSGKPTNEPSQSATEAYRRVRTMIDVLMPAAAPRRLLVTSAVDDEHASSTAANLSVVLAGAGHRVALIDGDLRSGAIAELFRLDAVPGLVEILRNKADAAKAVRSVAVPGSGTLLVLPTGETISDSAQLLGSRAFRQVLSSLDARADYVVINAPPVLVVSDALILARYVDCSLLSVRAGRSRQREVQATIDLLSTTGTKVLGTIFNDAGGAAVDPASLLGGNAISPRALDPSRP